MLKIKLSRTGKRHQANYRVIVAEDRSKRDGKAVDLLGSYNPNLNPAVVKIDLDKYAAWVAKGAKPTHTVATIHKKLVAKKNKPASKPAKAKKAAPKKAVKKTKK